MQASHQEQQQQHTRKVNRIEEESETSAVSKDTLGETPGNHDTEGREWKSAKTNESMRTVCKKMKEKNRIQFIKSTRNDVS